MLPLRRSLLFMPGDSARKIEKAAQLDADSVVMDLEDAVAPANKALARQTTRAALQTMDFGRRERLVRTNAWQTPFFADDVAETIAGRPDGYVIPKVHSAEDLAAARDLIAAQARQHGVEAGAIALLAIIETAKGVMNLREIAQLGPPLQALIFGADDLAADIGAVRTPSSIEVLYARSAVVIAAAANGLQAIDIVFFDLNDLAGLEEECRFGRQLGYTGKMVIHPRQLEIVNRAFAPSPEEIARAQRIVQAAREQAAAGLGAFALDGRMVDGPIIKQAENVLARARAAGLL
ncbi:MAG: CoA ester lyase [Anaerolineae bacterium]|nr:CoA ester lyase [Candidatus Roseilinea sp.]MDW8449134.1 CoA ester lyase [Anaerolineae bacterium]